MKKLINSTRENSTPKTNSKTLKIDSNKIEKYNYIFKDLKLTVFPVTYYEKNKNPKIGIKIDILSNSDFLLSFLEILEYNSKNEITDLKILSQKIISNKKIFSSEFTAIRI